MKGKITPNVELGEFWGHGGRPDAMIAVSLICFKITCMECVLEPMCGLQGREEDNCPEIFGRNRDVGFRGCRIGEV